MAESREVPIILLGLGNVGRALLRQIRDTAEALTQRAGLRLAPIGLADTTGLLFDPDGLAEDTLQDALRAKRDRRSVSDLPGSRPLTDLDGALRSGVIVVDATASTETEPTLRAALNGDRQSASHCSVVLANKHPLSGPWEKARYFLNHPRLRYEATVGAGLPVIATLRYLLDTGDRITAIEGCFSGTLGYLCAQLERGEPYAGAVAQARKLGYTEPDPREDLSGRDVARKALILARTVRLSSPQPAAWPLHMTDLPVEALYPDALAGVTTEAFMDTTSTLNETYADRFEAARANGHTVRYVARISPEGGEVGLTSVPQDSPLGALSGPTNYVAFHTERYAEVPLVISGPGAGPEVTAAGVLGDIVDLLRDA
ncbi:MAG: homoserine dehydrogenase [Anaerolineae bacterium]|jgi:homoserine dehydrogenase